MNRDDIGRLLVEARRVTNHRDYVIIGSLSVLGAVAHPPTSMTGSIDVDLYPKNDPGRASEIADALGMGSEFEKEYGYYADAVSPMLPTLPEDWNKRLIEVKLEGGVNAWFLDPNDAAISKYVRGEPRDLEWIKYGLDAGIVSLPTVEYRLRETIMETDERQRAKAFIANDVSYVAARKGSDALDVFVDNPAKETLLDRGQVEIEETAVSLKRLPVFQFLSEDRLYKLAEMRVAFENDLEKSNLDSHVYQDRLDKFDKHFSKPENLDAYLEARKEALDKPSTKATVDLDKGIEL